MQLLNGLLFACSCTLWIIVGAENERIQNNSVTVEKEKSYEDVGSIQCGETNRVADICFKDMPDHLIKFLQTKKSVNNQDDIAAKCMVFDHGMACFDGYTARCLTEEMMEVYKNNVEGARKFFSKFCNDTGFQRGYLRHKDCFAYIESDWTKCTQSFQTILSEELYAIENDPVQKFLAFCCARKAYENCIHNSARAKCFHHSAEFARETAQMLSDERQFANCRHYEGVFCQRRDKKYSGVAATVPFRGITGLLLIVLLSCTLRA